MKDWYEDEDDEPWAEPAWQSEEDVIRDVLKAFVFDELSELILREVAVLLIERGIDHARVVGEFDEETGANRLAVVLPDGSEVTYP